jgi:hypothetical protein
MRSRTRIRSMRHRPRLALLLALLPVLVGGTSACAEDLTTIAFQIDEPDPPEPVWVVAVMDTFSTGVGWSWGGPGEPIRFPVSGSMGLGRGIGGTRVQICAVGRGEEDRLFSAASDEVRLVDQQTVAVTMRLEAVAGESEVPPQCQPALVDAGVPGVPTPP